MSKMYKNDVGTVILVNTNVDLTGATTTKLLVEKPDKTNVQWNATIDNALGGVLRYITATGDLNLTGRYTLNAYIEFGGVTKLRGATVFFEVYD